MDIGSELFNPRIGSFDLGPQRGVWCKLRIAQPVMADHSVFVTVRSSASFQIAHGRKRLVDLRSHLIEVTLRKFHPTDVDRETEIVVAQKVLLKSLPERRRRHIYE